MCVYVFFLYPYLKELLGHGYKDMANGETLKALLVCQQFFHEGWARAVTFIQYRT